MNYILITSAYNEEKNISRAIESVTKQTVLPLVWIIVDDESNDSTSRIIREYSSRYPWIKYLFKKNDKIGIPGHHAMINFYYALSTVPNDLNYEFIGHLDADIVIDRNDYYQFQIKRMLNDSSIGITSGITYYYDEIGRKKLVYSYKWHTVGGLKFYRKLCFMDISPIPADIGWDGIDEFKAMAKGWKTEKFLELEVNHLGAMRDLYRNLNTNHYYFYGKSTYQRGRLFGFAFYKALKIGFDKSLLCSIRYLKGYITAMYNKEPKLHTMYEIRFIRKFDRKRVFKKLV